MSHGYQFDRMGVQGSFIGRTFLNEAIVHAEVCRQFGGGIDRLVGNDDVCSAVIQDTDNGTVLHRPAGEVAHAFVSAFAVEVATFQMGKRGSNLLYFADGRQCFDFIVYEFVMFRVMFPPLRSAHPFCQRYPATSAA